MSDTTDLQADFIGSVGQYAEPCGVCCRVPGLCAGASWAIGRMSSVPLNDGQRTSLPVCGDCTVLLLTGDWSGIEELVFAYQAADWKRWESIVHRRRARRVARRISRAAHDLFSSLSDPNDAPPERGAHDGR